MERDEEGPMRSENPVAVVTGALPRLEPLRYVRTDALEVAYFEAGPSDGEVALLLHGFPYDIHSYVDVIPRLVEAGHRVIAPYLRGYGPTHFLDSAAPRSLLNPQTSREHWQTGADCWPFTSLACIAGSLIFTVKPEFSFKTM